MALHVDQRRVGDRLVLVCRGAVDISTLPALHNALARAIADAPGATVAVDLDEVDSLDDAGLGIVLGAAGRARRGGGDVVVVSNDTALRERFSVTVTVVAPSPRPDQTAR